MYAFALVAGLASVAPAQEQTGNPQLDTAIRLYRADGAAAALADFQRLQRAFQSGGQRQLDAIARRYIGESHWRLGNLEESGIWLGRALDAMRETGDRLGEGKVLNVIGLLHWDLGELEQALIAMRLASDIAEELGNDLLAASTLNNMGLVHDELGNYRASLDEFQRSHRLFTDAANLRGQGDALGNIGGVHLLLGHFSEALAHYHKSLAISEQLNSKPAMTIDHGNIALSHLGLGDYAAALEHFDRALALSVETGMHQEQAYWQRGKANTLVRQGRYDLGLELHRLALTAWEESGAHLLLLDGLHDMGHLHLRLGDPVSAENYFDRALAMAREIGQRQAVTLNLLALGDLHARLEQPEEARALYLEARQRADEAGELDLQAHALLRLSAQQHAAGDFDAAAQHAAGALALAQRTGARATEAEAWFAQAEVARGLGQVDAAVRDYAAAAGAGGHHGDPDLAWRINYGRGLALAQDGATPAAVAELQAAVTVIESVRDRLREQRFRSGYLQDKFQVYVDLVRMQMELGLTGDAFSTAERLRARAFVAQLDQAEPALLSEAERRLERQFRERIRQLQERVQEEFGKNTAERRQPALEAYSTELMMAERDYQAFQDDLHSRMPALAAAEAPQLAQVQARLGDGDALVEYLLAGDEVLAFVVRNKRISASVTAVGQVQLAARVRLLRDMLTEPANQRWLRPAEALGETLLAPLFKQNMLEDVQRLHVVPHGVLHYLPFAVLPVAEGQLLMERFTLSYLPSASVLVVPEHSGSAGRGLLAMAPRRGGLQHTRTEARVIASMFKPASTLFEGTAATESAFKQDAPTHELLHLATHGYFNRHNPLLSGLELEQDADNDGLLEVHEILGLQLDARLVTLSACQTGLGSGWFDEFPAGDDFVGLTRAFLVAGSQAVLATLWEVDDRSTVNLMQGFYQRLASPPGEQDQAEALVRAQREMRASTEFNHPFYWAPFVLVGSHDLPAARG